MYIYDYLGQIYFQFQFSVFRYRRQCRRPSEAYPYTRDANLPLSRFIPSCKVG
ncbi:MAG: hypothetical protein LBH04_05775 [Tannerellaceae bacterium]|nr:hypothetical protein [Tannerellaceae bacterium]